MSTSIFTPQSLVSSDKIEHAKWRQLVAELFHDVDSASLFRELWDRFADPAAWYVYPEVETVWNRLSSSGWLIGIASNFDSRLLPIVKSFTILEQATFVFCSAQIGFRKPDPEFYRLVQDTILCSKTDASSSQLEIVMVGDDFENDFVGPTQFGWKAFHLDAGSSDGIASKLDLQSKQANVIRSLLDLPRELIDV